MTRYIIRRLLQGIPLVFLISILLFVMLQNMGDPLATMGGRTVTRREDRERLARQLGLDKPILVQYVYWLVGNDWTKVDINGDGIAETPGIRKGVLRGDFGTSLVTRQPAMQLILSRLPNTLLLMLVSELVVVLGALFIGVYSALKQYSFFDNLITTLSFIGYSMPIFFLALGAMYIFAVNFKRWGLPYLPTVGMFDPPSGTDTRSAVVAFDPAGYRDLDKQFFRIQPIYPEYDAGSYEPGLYPHGAPKGLPRRETVFIHALKNASLPIVTIVGLDLPFLLGGALVTERIFAWPGMGRLFIDHVSRGDTPVVMGIMMLIAVAVVVFQILTDVVYAWLDPRIRYD